MKIEVATDPVVEGKSPLDITSGVWTEGEDS
jgi:hypothetical protein